MNYLFRAGFTICAKLFPFSYQYYLKKAKKQARHRIIEIKSERLKPEVLTTLILMAQSRKHCRGKNKKKFDG